MMDRLETPDEFAGFRAERHKGVGKPVVAGTFAAVVVRAGAARWHENQLTCEVGNNDRPGIGGSGAACTAIFPAIGARQAGGLWNRVPRPLLFAARRVEAADFTGWLVGSIIVGNCRTDDHGIANNGGRRRLLVVGKAVRIG